MVREPYQLRAIAMFCRCRYCFFGIEMGNVEAARVMGKAQRKICQVPTICWSHTSSFESSVTGCRAGIEDSLNPFNFQDAFLGGRGDAFECSGVWGMTPPTPRSRCRFSTFDSCPSLIEDFLLMVQIHRHKAELLERKRPALLSIFWRGFSPDFSSLPPRLRHIDPSQFL